MNSSNHSSVVSGYLQLDIAVTTACYAVNLILSLPTNVYVLWLILSGAGGTMASEFFTLNLAVSEILFCLSSVFVFVYIHLHIPPLRAIASFINGFIIPGRPLFQCCICFERYLAVVHPVVFLKYRPLRYKVGCSGLVWLVLIGFCFPFLFVMQHNFLFYVFCVEIIILISFLLFCCLSVLRALKQSGPGEGEREREGTNNMKMRAFKIIFIIMVSMMADYFPWANCNLFVYNCFVIAYKEVKNPGRKPEPIGEGPGGHLPSVVAPVRGAAPSPYADPSASVEPDHGSSPEALNWEPPLEALDCGLSLETPEWGLSLETPDWGTSLETPDWGPSLEAPDCGPSLKVPDCVPSLEVPDCGPSQEVPDCETSPEALD
ncbi:P2Y purinoceptor 6-like [Oncorhynchus masou masou]|uniref:P2Y purinoceptor 6-like n=1 Tax=Oncorhynchus masou masou TaxID=90313 RepID=UPI003182CA77